MIRNRVLVGNYDFDLSYFITTVRTNNKDGVFCCISRCTDAEVVINEVAMPVCVQTQYKDFLFTYSCTGNGVKLFMKLHLNYP